MSMHPLHAKALHRLDDSAVAMTKRKFDIAYVIAKNNMAFLNMACLCELEERHGVDLGRGYKNNRACAEFIDYIAVAESTGITLPSYVGTLAYRPMVALMREMWRTKFFWRSTVISVAQKGKSMFAANFSQ